MRSTLLQAATLRTRDIALQQALAERNIDNIELRRQLAAARQAADPHIAQVITTLLFHFFCVIVGSSLAPVRLLSIC